MSRGRPSGGFHERTSAMPSGSHRRSPALRADCPVWCRVDHVTHPRVDHSSRPLWLNPRLDDVTASVGVLSFLDSVAIPSGAAVVSLRLRQREIADKDTVELTPSEARRL